MLLQRGLERLGQHGYSILRALAVADQNFVAEKVDILYAQAKALHQTQPCAIHQRGHQPLVAGKIRQHGFDFIAGQHDGKAGGLAGTDDFAQIADFAAKDVSIKEKDGGKRLILRRSGDLFLDRQIRQKSVYFWFSHLLRMTDIVKIDESLHPTTICLFGSLTVMAGS